MCVVFGYSRTQCFSTKLSYLYIQSKNACTHLALLYAFSTPKNRHMYISVGRTAPRATRTRICSGIFIKEITRGSYYSCKKVYCIVYYYI